MAEMRTIASAATETARVRCRMPLLLWRSLVFYHPDGGAVATVDLVWTTPRRWGRLAASRETSWRVVGVGPFILAVRFLL